MGGAPGPTAHPSLSKGQETFLVKITQGLGWGRGACSNYRVKLRLADSLFCLSFFCPDLLLLLESQVLSKDYLQTQPGSRGPQEDI